MKTTILITGIIGISFVLFISGVVAMNMLNTRGMHQDSTAMPLTQDSTKSMHSNSMLQMEEMHDEMLRDMNTNLEGADSEEKQGIQEMIKHMESCPMMK